MKKTTQVEITEATKRPDSIWLSLEAGKQEAHETVIVNWDEINELNGDFGNYKAVVVVGIPLYSDFMDTEDILHAATKYVFNQIEIREKTKENKELFAGIGGGY